MFQNPQQDLDQPKNKKKPLKRKLTSVQPIKLTIQEEGNLKLLNEYQNTEWFTENPEIYRSETVFGTEVLKNQPERKSNFRAM